jgi:hypothetical protein
MDSDIVNVSSLPDLVNLNLKGNKFCSHGSYRDDLLALVPTLRVLDGTRFDSKFLERKEKRKKFKELIETIEERRRKQAEEHQNEEDARNEHTESRGSKPFGNKKVGDSKSNRKPALLEVAQVTQPTEEEKSERVIRRVKKWGTRRKLLEKRAQYQKL